ncbi:hypothetical protein M5G22_24895 [Pseudomonas sp. TNT2022 ID233]|jgi:hypothetical protein|uniref:hypothetical protein n=1 Tax=Pseudomonas aphyarum TaxID=2942629 RepID=UPI0023618D90|nr:hypothetical protein [Pseudomonas aphyarum]MDD1140813.1 hypothetical protein [Pseudomonas aphyarum]
MASGKFENVQMKFIPGNGWDTSDEFKASGLGPDNGQGRFGGMTFYYQEGTTWVAFATAVCGSQDNGPNIIGYVKQAGSFPKGKVKVCATFTADGLPPNGAASDPVLVDFH